MYPGQTSPSTAAKCPLMASATPIHAYVLAGKNRTPSGLVVGGCAPLAATPPGPAPNVATVGAASVASDKTGKKLLLQGVLPVPQQAPFPLCYIPCRDYHRTTCVSLQDTSSCLSKVSNSRWALSQCSHCCSCCYYTQWVMSACRGASSRPREVASGGLCLARRVCPA